MCKFMMIQENIRAVKEWAGKIRTAAQKSGGKGVFNGIWCLDCFLCLESTEGAALCQNCERLLAKSGFACPVCAVPLPAGGRCGECLRDPPPFDDVLTAFDYRFPLDRLVQRFKFSADLAVGAYLGDALAKAVATGTKPDLIVASPASRARLIERGFNPALVLATRVASGLHMKVEPRSLAKVRHTPAQTGLDRAFRRRNLRGAFAVCRPVQGLHVAVVDDVMTTGATLGELAGTLKRAGAGWVENWVIARTLPRDV